MSISNNVQKRYCKKTMPQKKRRHMDFSILQIYSLGFIPLLLIFIFNYLPMFGIIIAFKNYRFDKGILGSEWVGFENFKMLLQSNDFFNITRNTLVLNSYFIVFGTAAALLLAIMLYELTNRLFTKIYQTIMITPYFLSWVVVGYMAYAILHPSYGYFNRLLVLLGLQQVDWYSTPKAWPMILTIASVWKSMGIDSVIYYAALMGIDISLYESASVEGASRLHKIWYITLPSIFSLITILTILKIGNIFRADFGLFYQLTRDIGTLYSTADVIDTYIFRSMRVIGDMSVSSATGLLQSVVGFVLVLFTNHISKKINPDNGLF